MNVIFVSLMIAIVIGEESEKQFPYDMLEYLHRIHSEQQ